MNPSPISRREFLAATAAAAAAQAAPQSGAALPSKRPNILWIVADDHAPYVTGTYGNRRVATPNFDHFAARGIRFDRAFCCSPVCTASRQCFITGQYPRTIGVTQLSTALPASQTTLAHRLADRGFDTAAIGKMHFNSNLKHGFETRIDLEDWNTWLKTRTRTPLPAGIAAQPPWRPFKDPASVWLNSACLPFSFMAADTSAAYFAHEAERFLRQPREKPFFLVVSFYEPHSPFNFPPEFRGRHRPDDFAAPAPGPQDAAQVPLVFRDLTDAQKRGSIAAYHTSVEFLDRSVGRVLAALDRSDKAANTIVVYLADHGYMLGQHGRFEKHCGYDPAMSVPLIVRMPQVITAGRTCDAMVQTIDLVPTMLDLCGLPIAAEIQGKSILPLLKGQTDRHRQTLVIEYSENAEAYIRTDRWKFIYCAGNRIRQDGYVTDHPLPGRTIRLYDLAADPEEMTSLADHPQHAALVERFTGELADHMVHTARQPELIPRTSDPRQILDFCLQPRDVAARA